MKEFLILAVGGFVIGMITNWLVLIFLFHPRKKILGIQGIIPKRKSVLARKIGEISPMIMPPYILKAGKIPIIGPKIIRVFQESVALRIESLSNEELEVLVNSILHREFQFIIWMGGILGFILGCVQYLIL